MDATVRIALLCGDSNPSDYVIVDRVVPRDGAPLTAALNQLLLGVTPQEAEVGLRSAFHAFTAGRLIGVTIEGGLATIEWAPAFVTTNNFSTSTLSGVVLTQIAATVFLFEGISGIEFLVGGERWCGWESAGCDDVPVPRNGREDFAPVECVDAWRSGETAPIRCEDRVAAFVVTMAEEE